MARVEWRDVPGYEGIYKVSSKGDVVSIPRRIWNGKGLFVSKEKALKPNTLAKGYLQVDLKRDNKRHPLQVHRLVAMAFIPNPEGYDQVNHKDGNKQNNCVENLEWCNNSLNQFHAWRTGLQKPRIAGKPMRPVRLTRGDEVLEFKCVADAGRFLGAASKTQLCKVLAKKKGYNTVKGYQANYAE